MEELFGLSMDVVMTALLAIFAAAMAVVAVLALRNRIMLKLGLRPIPRRRGQTVLIIVGVMLSTVIMAAAFGTGDTITYSIRNQALISLAHIDEIILSTRAGATDSFGSSSYIPYERFEQLEADLAGDDDIDGLAPQLAEAAPVIDVRTSLSAGRMRVVGIDGSRLAGFAGFTLAANGEARIEDLREGEAYINDRAAEELDGRTGDELQLFLADKVVSFEVRAVVERGGMAGSAPTLILPLESAQRVFDRLGQINLIVVSNRGNEFTGAAVSDELTERLRVRFTDRAVASDLKALLDQDAVHEALEEKAQSVSDDARAELSELRAELGREELSDELTSLFGDLRVVGTVLEALEEAELRETAAAAIALLADLGEFRVLDVKHDLLSEADEAGAQTTSIFITMALFSIGVGVLLIFLIFVMLAAARRSEMGMARAVGAKRVHLVQMFTFEGTAYALVSAAVGVVVGLGVSALIVGPVNRVVSGLDADFRLVTHFEPRSAIVAYCLGMAITFATVAFSSYRVSRLNIVMAIRDLPEALMIAGEPPFRQRLTILARSLVRPLIFLGGGFRSLFKRRFVGFLRNIALTALWLLVLPWIVDVAVAVLRFIWPYLLRGWLTVLVGFLVMYWGVAIERDSPFAAGISLVVLGLGLMGRKLLQRTSMRPERVDRIAFTTAAVVMLVWWSLWKVILGRLEAVTGELEGDFDVMSVSGIFMVGSAVLAIMWNADLLVRVLTYVTGRTGKLRPVLVTAVAYPMSSKFRTGLTLAMFALVIFTLMVMSVLTDSFSTSFSNDPETVAGGWDIEGEVNFNTPIEDIRQAIAQEPKLDMDDFEAIGGYTWVRTQVRQVGAKSQQWRSYGVRAADDQFLEASQYRLKLIADGYGTTPDEMWEAMMTQPGLAVVEGDVLLTRADADSDFHSFMEGPSYYNDESMAPVDIEVREPRTGTIIPLTVIGVLDRIHESFNGHGGMIISKATLDSAVPFSVPIVTYQFRLAEGVDAERTAKDIEASFRENGMETTALVEMIEQLLGAFRVFFSIFTAFMGLGVVVGIAALGVVSTRAVVERRHQIGVLRAIGYRRRMVQLSFLLEFSFVALLGTAIGVVLGLILGANAISDIRAEEANQNLRLSIPWTQIIVITALTYVFSMVATFLPARQASRIHPAEALRYE